MLECLQGTGSGVLGPRGTGTNTDRAWHPGNHPGLSSEELQGSSHTPDHKQRQSHELQGLHLERFYQRASQTRRGWPSLRTGTHPATVPHFGSKSYRNCNHWPAKSTRPHLRVPLPEHTLQTGFRQSGSSPHLGKKMPVAALVKSFAELSALCTCTPTDLRRD